MTDNRKQTQNLLDRIEDDGGEFAQFLNKIKATYHSEGSYHLGIDFNVHAAVVILALALKLRPNSNPADAAAMFLQDAIQFTYHNTPGDILTLDDLKIQMAAIAAEIGVPQ